MKYGSTYYNTFTMGVRSKYHIYLFQCNINKLTLTLGWSLFDEVSNPSALTPWRAFIYIKKYCVKCKADRIMLIGTALYLKINIEFKSGKTRFLVFHVIDRENSEKFKSFIVFSLSRCE